MRVAVAGSSRNSLLRIINFASTFLPFCVFLIHFRILIYWSWSPRNSGSFIVVQTLFQTWFCVAVWRALITKATQHWHHSRSASKRTTEATINKQVARAVYIVTDTNFMQSANSFFRAVSLADFFSPLSMRSTSIGKQKHSARDERRKSRFHHTTNCVTNSGVSTIGASTKPILETEMLYFFGENHEKLVSWRAFRWASFFLPGRSCVYEPQASRCWCAAYALCIRRSLPSHASHSQCHSFAGIGCVDGFWGGAVIYIVLVEVFLISEREKHFNK